MSKIITGLALLGVVLSTIGCAGRTFDVGEPWNITETRFFDDGADLLDDPLKLTGRNRIDQKALIEGRASTADFIAVVDLLSIQTARDANGQVQKYLSARTIKNLYGRIPADEFRLVSRPASSGYVLIERYEAGLKGKFIVYVRWFKRPDQTLGHHFHLSPASDVLVRRVEEQVQNRLKKEEGGKAEADESAVVKPQGYQHARSAVDHV